jgi:hypothetical protein
VFYEYKSIVVEDHPDGPLNTHAAQSVEGWELLTVTVGGFAQAGRFHAMANVLFLRRKLAAGSHNNQRPAAATNSNRKIR